MNVLEKVVCSATQVMASMPALASMPAIPLTPEWSSVYGALIRAHWKGRVYYRSPSHNAKSFEDPRMLGFLLDSLQYVLGDLACDDAPRRP